MRVAHAQPLRAGVRERDAAEAAALDGDRLPTRTQERRQSSICRYGVVNRARCELFRESRGEKGVIEAWRDATFRLADHASGYPESPGIGAHCLLSALNGGDGWP